MRERFFAIDMFSAPHGFHGNDRVGVIGRSDDHAVHARTHLVEHDPVIGEPLRLRVLGELVRRILLIDVTQRHDVVPEPRGFADIRPAATSDPDAGKIQFVVGRQGICAPRRHAAGY